MSEHKAGAELWLRQNSEKWGLVRNPEKMRSFMDNLRRRKENRRSPPTNRKLCPISPFAFRVQMDLFTCLFAERAMRDHIPTDLLRR